MGTTPNLAIPYTEPTDDLATYPAQDQEQAERLDSVLYAPSASYLRSTVVTCAATSQTPVLFDVAIAPLVGITYNPATGTFTVPVAGRYLVLGSLVWKYVTSGYRQIRILKNGALYDLREMPYPSASADSAQAISRTLQLAAGDTLVLAAYSYVTADLVANSIRAYCSMEIYRLGP